MRKSFWIGLLLLLLAGWGYQMVPEPVLPSGTRIDRLVVHKSQRQLLAYAEGVVVKRYRISLGRVPRGDKQIEGDRKTPEGLYEINDKNARSAYHKNLGVSYPNARDRAEAQALGKPVGGDIKIHGLRNGLGWLGKFHRWFDWTMGCVAVTNAEIDELYAAVPLGTPIELLP
jgi:murein L,D-transpeptidase YafK